MATKIELVCPSCGHRLPISEGWSPGFGNPPFPCPNCQTPMAVWTTLAGGMAGKLLYLSESQDMSAWNVDNFKRVDKAVEDIAAHFTDRYRRESWDDAPWVEESG